MSEIEGRVKYLSDEEKKRFDMTEEEVEEAHEAAQSDEERIEAERGENAAERTKDALLGSKSEEQ